MEEYENEFELMDYLNVIWKRKWLIIIPTFILVVFVGIYSLTLPKVWEVHALIVPSKIILRTDDGQFDEVLVTDPKQIAGQINQAAYTPLIAAKLNLNPREFPNLNAENIRDTNLVRISAKVNDVEKAKSILFSLFDHLKNELDKKIDVEFKDIDTKIAANKNLIQYKNLTIKDILNGIKLKQIEKNKTTQEISTAENKLQISKDRTTSIMEEMKAVKKRIDDLDEQLKNALAEEKEGLEAISLLLYSSEVQNNFRYYNTLDEKLTSEKITQENLNLTIYEKKEGIKEYDTQIDNLNTEIDKINNEKENVENQNELLIERKARLDFTELIKEPTSSLGPVAPRKKVMVIIAGMLGLFIFTILAFFLEYIAKQKIKVKD